MTREGSTALPDLHELVHRSAWLGEQDGLRESVSTWLEEATVERARLAQQAARLARPSIGWSTLRAVAGTGARVLTSVGPRGLTDVFLAATQARARSTGDRGLQGKSRQSSAIAAARRLVETGGPSYVKFGQFIASGRGLLPDEWVDAFAWCRDEVPPLAEGVAESIVTRAFGRAPHEIFDDFDPVPLAAASIAQVHRAQLRDGTDVVVKVRRPGLSSRFASDIRVVSLLASSAERLVPEARMANLSGFVELFAQIVLEELDLRLEAVNIVELALTSEVAGHEHVSFPHPIPGLIASDVLVMRQIRGVRYTDAHRTYQGVVDGGRLVRLAIQSLLEQAMIYGVFHGDLHAGNVFIDQNGDFSLVDFGIIGRLTVEQRAGLVRFLIGFARNDVRAQMDAIREFGAMGDEIEFERLVIELQAQAEKTRDVRITGGALPKGLGELSESMSTIIRQLTRSGFVVPKEVVLFFRNILYLTAMAAELAPDANLLDEVGPLFAYFAEKYPQTIDPMARS